MNSTRNTYSDEASDIVLSDQEYEVFLSFRGPDTRAGFTDHLFRRLIDANIKTYRDDEELQKGEEIRPELLQAINKSTIAIPIFSKRYAESKWCLEELVEINSHRRSRDMKVMPIFYYVTPSEVQNQNGCFEETFALHERKYDNTLVKKWKEALSQIGSLAGWEIPSNTYSREGELIEDVTKEMSFTLTKAYVKIPDHLVGLSCHVEKILEMLSIETHGVRILGIHGMGGIGKTTLAKFVYNHLLSKFQGSSFLADARSKNIEDLGTNLISDILARKSWNYINKETSVERFKDKKVLLVIDDVDEKTRIEDLIGKRGKYRFGSGSRIILTSRDEGFLRQVQVDKSYELSGMDRVHSLKLFCRHAFESSNPELDYAILSMQIVETTGGLPLALEVIGSSLRHKSKREWRNILEKLKDVPAKDVGHKLRISYDELDDRQKHIFLDIACFFIGKDPKIVIHFWDPLKFYPEEAMCVLQQKSLIKMHHDLLWMHDQLRDLGREIVRGGYIMELEKQTRLWDEEEATKIFMTKKATEKIQGICVEVKKESCLYFTEEEFAKLSQVRLFWLRQHPYSDECDWSSCAAPSNYFPPRKPHIFSEIRWLSWHRFPYEYIDLHNFSLVNLTILNLSYSTFTIDWGGWSQIKMAKNLKVLDLTECRYLVKTPDFSSHLLLEQLILEKCTGLIEIDKSIGMLVHLVHLNLKDCLSLRKLPTEVNCMEALTELLLDDTRIIEISPWYSGDICMTSLEKLLLRRTTITSISDSIGRLVHMSKLYLSGCKSLRKLPEAIGGLVSLIELDISYSGIEELPNSICCLKNLKLLRMSKTSIRELPTTIGMAEKLENIDASYCKCLIGLPKLPESIINLTLPINTMVTIPDLSNLIQLEQLVVVLPINDNKMDGWLPRSSIEMTRVEMPSPRWIGKLSKAERLDLAFPTIIALHPDLGALSLLTELNIHTCYQLQSVPKLPSNLRKLEVIYCSLLETISDLSHLRKLSTLNIEGTPLIKIEGLHCLESLQKLTLEGCMFPAIDGMPENLRHLRISNCKNLERLPQMSKYKKLVEFFLSMCDSLVEIRGRLESIERLSINSCKSLVKIPDVLDVKTLKRLRILGCSKIHDEDIIFTSLILENGSLTSQSELRVMTTMLQPCPYSQNNAFENVEVVGKGKKRKQVQT